MIRIYEGNADALKERGAALPHTGEGALLSWRARIMHEHVVEMRHVVRQSIIEYRSPCGTG